MTGKEYLKQIKKIETLLKNKNVELKRVEELGLATDSVKDSITKLQIERDAIIATIEQLPEADYDVLHKVYIQYETLYEVATEKKISYSLATTIHGRALKMIENIINANN